MDSILIIGKPNSGKSLLFNKITGVFQKVSNFPGVTVEVKKAKGSKCNRCWKILAEVTNTPWKERFSYVLRASNNKQENKIKSEMKKELHVSPFWDMEHVYDWAFSSPMDKLNVFMKNYKDGEKVFDATLNLKRSILNKKWIN